MRGILVLVFGGISSLAVASHDSVITLTTDYGLDQYRPSGSSIAHKTIDATGAKWTVSNSKNPNPTWANDCDEGTDEIRKYPLILEHSNDWLIKGGLVRSLVPQESEWKPTYCNSAAAAFFNSDDSIVDGIRVLGGWDGVRFSQGADRWTLRNAWVSDVRDDCVENDQLRSGKIEDSLFDGCWIGPSFDAGGNSTATGLGEVVTIDGVLLRLKPYWYRKNEGDTLKFTHGQFFKGAGLEMEFVLKNLLFAAEVDPFHSTSRLTSVLDNTIECSNNTFLWLGPGAVPDVFADNLISPCWTTITGQEAMDMWNTAKANWINCHPDTTRGANDPVSNPALCNTGEQQLAAPQNLTVN